MKNPRRLQIPTNSGVYGKLTLVLYKGWIAHMVLHIALNTCRYQYLREHTASQSNFM